MIYLVASLSNELMSLPVEVTIQPRAPIPNVTDTPPPFTSVFTYPDMGSTLEYTSTHVLSSRKGN